MTDREKVVEQLESMRDYHRSAGNNITADIANDALELLKEQEEKQIPKQIIFSDGYEEYWGKEEICPTCGKRWMSAEIDTTHFCPGCGRAVKLE